MEYVVLNNGLKMPKLGLGVYQITDEFECRNTVESALDIGYRLIDTAQAYHNEKFVGDAIKQSNIPREELFITTKLWLADTGYKSTIKAFENSLKRVFHTAYFRAAFQHSFPEVQNVSHKSLAKIVQIVLH